MGTGMLEQDMRFIIALGEVAPSLRADAESEYKEIEQKLSSIRQLGKLRR